MNYTDRNCGSRCDESLDCFGYMIPESRNREYCETFGSFGVKGDGTPGFKCYSMITIFKIAYP